MMEHKIQMKIVLAVLLVLMLITPVRADVTASLPYTLNFDSDSWVANLAMEECGGTSTHVTEGCYAGGCAKIIPPTSLCTGGGINGGATGLGWVNYSAQTEIHIRFLIKFGSAWAENYTGSDTNKFILQDGGGRASIMSFNCSGTGAARYCAFGVLNYNEAYVYRTPPNRGWIEDAEFRVGGAGNAHEGEWFAVEYALNIGTDKGQIYVWTADGTYNGLIVDNVTIDTAVTQMTGFYISYYNGMGTANANNYYLMDNFAVSSSYIGPPDGFVEGADTTAPTVTDVSSDKANGSYTTGEVIDIDVAFSEPVTSTGNVTMTCETGDTDRTCTFTVTNATTGTCNYTVQAGDTSADLNCVVSGTIADQASNAMSVFTATNTLAANKALVIDTTAPTVDAFTVPETSATRLVTSSTFTCTGASHYIMNESAVAPLASADGWTATAPTSYTFGSDGAKTLYGWCKDTAGNVSTSVSDTVTVTTTGVISKAPFIIP